MWYTIPYSSYRVRGARSQRQEDDGQLAKVKLNLLAGLRTEVRRARSNGELGALVEDFSRITNRSSAKTITKVRSLAQQFLPQYIKSVDRTGSPFWRAWWLD